jgi:hypothetical protein
LLSKSENKIIAEYAKKRLDKWDIK